MHDGLGCVRVGPLPDRSGGLERAERLEVRLESAQQRGGLLGLLGVDRLMRQPE
ncbi:hypothetical protein FHX74_000447 [Friedmanniella endophytica]|uniref:Uncharacterized protein n=1 Tax=Microlunatus kandeliicorticis TaxID=1759536 RepID=A0A7W3P4G2_9ACTN|nr:hypothetical protein [Microlunatus kandeliicorticis]MBA8792853.1 hypothetical protein [Microlunatus kandeliicorticis]